MSKSEKTLYIILLFLNAFSFVNLLISKNYFASIWVLNATIWMGFAYLQRKKNLQ